MPEPISEVTKEESKKEEVEVEKEEKEKDRTNEVMEIHKPAPSIPKVMPVQ